MVEDHWEKQETPYNDNNGSKPHNLRTHPPRDFNFTRRPTYSAAVSTGRWLVKLKIGRWYRSVISYSGVISARFTIGYVCHAWLQDTLSVANHQRDLYCLRMRMRMLFNDPYQIILCPSVRAMKFNTLTVSTEKLYNSHQMP